MTGVSRFDCYPSDALNGMIGMTADEIAAYWVVILMQYDRGVPIAYLGRERELQVRAGMPKARLSSAIKTLLEKGKLELVDGALCNARTGKELAKITERIAKNSQNSKLGGEATKKHWSRASTKLEAKDNENNGETRPTATPTARPTARPAPGQPLGPTRAQPSSLPPSSLPPPDSSATAARERSLESRCRALLGEEPVLHDPNFVPILKAIDEGLTEADVIAGIAAAMADPEFRVVYWRQLVGWARTAAKKRLAEKPKPTNGHATPPPGEPKIDLGYGLRMTEKSIRAYIANPRPEFENHVGGRQSFLDAVKKYAPHLLEEKIA
jgi:hypothetical protein